MSETDLMMATQNVSLLKMQLGRQRQAVLRAHQEGGAAYEQAARFKLEALRLDLEAAETTLRLFCTGPRTAKPVDRAA